MSVHNTFPNESAALDNVYKKWESRGSGPINRNTNNSFFKSSSLSGAAASNGLHQKIPCISIQDIPIKVHLPDLVFQSSFPKNSLPIGYSHIQQIASCQACTPNSKHNTPYVYEIGIRDIFTGPSIAKYKSWMAWLFPITYHCLTKDCNHNYPSLRKEILSSRSLEDGIEKIVGEDEGKELRRELLNKEAGQLLNKISGKMSTWLIRFVGCVFHICMPFFIKNLYVNRTQISTLKELYKQQPTTSFLYLPTHQSHLDYLLITLVLFDANLPSPLIAAGMNLFIPVFRSILRSLGAFYIHRSHAGSNSSIYPLILKEYITTALQHGCHIEFYPEGTRSRSGKVNLPKNGLMAFVLGSILDSGVQDVYIIPTTISYECIFEDGITRELMGKEKVPESFMQVMKGLFKIFARFIGVVRIDFGQPYSLQEFARTGAMVDENGLKISRFCPYIEDDRYRKVKCLMSHVQYDWTRIQPTPGTGIISYLLLNAYREGTTLPLIERAYLAIQQEALLHGKIFLSQEPAAQAVESSLELISHLLLKSADPIPLYKPNLCLEQSLELFYFSNKAIYLFINEAIVASTLESLQADFTGPIGLVSRHQLLQKACTLCLHLSKEFIFGPPCQELSTMLLDVIDRMVTQELFQVKEASVLTSQERGLLRLVSTTMIQSDEDWELEDETMLVLSQIPEHRKWLSMFSSSLYPYILSYCLSVDALKNLSGDEQLDIWPMKKKDLEKYVHEAVCKGALSEGRPEACSIEIVRNWFLQMVCVGILTGGNTEQEYTLSSLEKLEEWRNSMASFRVRKIIEV
ncbi:Glycerol-3-phosphate acyltransferase 1, mitochondrial isoform X3 [Oopsacas minuta]|uniref:Glycerol-3-phosphate acyltransferase 1, mitochondrial isoform X3 n=1 Tax=Oopsacas minuta TaxID=111878 RepID=A0AAV7KHG4_9METZ|nr:Glycerol-3-phosphate acyltransferase 1, mitochondrial isoform X3 [Oopsacas minuta]